MLATRENDYQPPADLNHENLRFDFYFQATSYMAGFISGEAPSFPGVVSSALKTAAQSFTAKDGMRFYRFDVQNYDTGNGFEPYRLQQYQVEQEALGDEGFYSVAWYFNQDGRFPESYRGAYEDWMASRPDEIYDISGPYLLNTLDYIDKKNISVIFTDLTDTEFSTKKVFDWLSGYISENDNNAVSICAFNGNFNGKVYTGGYTEDENGAQTFSYDYSGGKRPFYALIIGDAAVVDTYRDAFIQGAGPSTLIGSCIFNGKKSVGAAMNFVGRSEVTRDNATLPEGANFKDLRIYELQQGHFKAKDPALRYIINNADTMAYGISRSFEGEGAVTMSLTIPYRGLGFWYEAKDAQFTSDISVYSAQKGDDGGMAWELNKNNPNLDLLLSGARDNITVINENGHYYLNMQLKIDKAALNALGPLNKDNEYRFDIKINNSNYPKTPDWAGKCFYSGAITKLATDDVDYFGLYTVVSESGFFESMANASRDGGKDNNTIADILLYFVY